ncbi:protein Hook homolog 3-like [Lethenteron reissneri]|uniref:protein Hook homolog 3-like n=1 Tax=Lethenteron reissneri TaxID=7753 RepID=UPI002AB628E9|nr:protein Hook homolog 3-like [Lethenteron reissneri]
MSLDKAELCESLLSWVRAYGFEVPCEDVSDLTDGVLMAHVLHRIDPGWFDVDFVARIKIDARDNWRLKLSNLKKILNALLSYYSEVVGQPVAQDAVPDVCLMAEHGHRGETGKALQLILGCAVNCDKKEEHIQTIMTLQESVQHVVMAAIQELMNKETQDSAAGHGLPDMERQLRRATEDLSEVEKMKEQLENRCHALTLQLESLQDDRGKVLAENKLLREQSGQWGALEEEAVRPPVVRSQQLEAFHEELFRLEGSRDEFRLRCEELERHVSVLEQKNQQLTSLAEEAQALKDEMDVLRHSSDRAARLEAAVESYRRKLDDLGDVRRQVRLLEERSSQQLHNTLALEEELRRANAARAQLHAYKQQVQELHARLSEESRRADRLEFEHKRLQERSDALTKEKERAVAERDALRETNEELCCTQIQQSQLEGSGILHGSQVSLEALEAEMVPAEFRERLIRLSHENRVLRLQSEGADSERVLTLRVELDESSRTQSVLQTDNRLLNQRVLELQAQLEELQKTLQEQGARATDSIVLTKKVEEHLEKLAEESSELKMQRALIEGLQPQANPASPSVEELQAALEQKERDMRAMEERYKRYLDKAKSVIKTLDPKQSPMTTTELQALRSQLRQKDNLVHSLERECEKTRQLREQEEKLIVSAWYNMGIGLPKGSRAGGASGGAGPTQSFLACQRQSTSARRAKQSHAQAGPSAARHSHA